MGGEFQRGFLPSKQINHTLVGGIDTTGRIDAIFIPVVGTLSDQRTGDVTQITAGFLRFGITVSDTTNVVRIMLVQSFGSDVPTTGTVLQNGPSGSPDVFSFYQNYTQTKFSILYDSVFGQYVNASTGQIVKSVRFPGNMFMRPSWQYNSGTQVEGGIYLLLISDSGVVPHPQVVYNTKFFYHDA